MDAERLMLSLRSDGETGLAVVAVATRCRLAGAGTRFAASHRRVALLPRRLRVSLPQKTH